MGHTLPLLTLRYLTMLLLFWGTPLIAADSDYSLIERLETADSARQQQDILDEIATRIADGPLSVALTDRLIAELMSDEMYGYHHIMRELPKLAGDQGFSEQALLELAKGLSGELIQQYTPAKAISKALSTTHATAGLPEPVFDELIVALEHIAMLNRSAAIEVLAVTRQEDDRHAMVVAAILETLNNNDHQHTRSSAIAGLAELAGDQGISANVLAGLVQSAKTDPYMTVRLDALELLADQDIDETLSGKLSKSLAEEIIAPTHELWERSSGLRNHSGLGDRSTAVLADLHVAPYPDHAVNAWIAQTRAHPLEKALAALRHVYIRGDLTSGQIAELVQIAEISRYAPSREMIYQMLFVELQAGTLMDALVGFENADEEVRRIRAGYALKEQYRVKGVPDRVANAAARVTIAGSNAEIRGIAASLLSNTQRDRVKRENQLIVAIESHPEDYDTHTAVIDFYGPDRIDDLVIKYASDPELSVTFRQSIIQELGKQKTTDAGLSPGAENTLKEVARNASDYNLVQYAGDTLKTWGIKPPLRVALMKRENQSITLFVVLISLVIVNFIAFISGLIAIFNIRVQAERKRVAIRTAMVIAWLALSTGMLVLLGAGGIGFLGHNSLPSPKATLLWNTPAYAGTFVYILLTWILCRRARTVPQ